MSYPYVQRFVQVSWILPQFLKGDCCSLYQLVTVSQSMWDRGYEYVAISDGIEWLPDESAVAYVENLNPWIQLIHGSSLHVSFLDRQETAMPRPTALTETTKRRLACKTLKLGFTSPASTARANSFFPSLVKRGTTRFPSNTYGLGH